MKIGILGGSFDPPHNGHLSLAKQVKDIYSIDQVLFIPCFSHPFAKELSSSRHRLAMTKLLENDWLKVSSLEIEQKSISYSIDTLQTLRKQNPLNKYSWIIGSDQVNSFPKWKDYKRIILDFSLLVLPRQETDEEIQRKLQETFQTSLLSHIAHISQKDLTLSPISSTEIRRIVKNGESISDLVPKNVEEYIRENKLYQ